MFFNLGKLEEELEMLDEVLPLYHATSDFERLCKILVEGFRPQFCHEEIEANLSEAEIKEATENYRPVSIPGMKEQSDYPFNTNLIAAYFPMISFCSTPLNDAICRMKSYGQYGIALSRNWGIKNRLNPVVYMEPNSELTRSFVKSFYWIRKYRPSDINFSISDHGLGEKYIAIRSLVGTFAYAKNFYGPLYRKGEMISEQYPFGYEREWRLWTSHDNLPRFVYASEFRENLSLKEDLNSKVDNLVRFSADDIESVVVGEESDVGKIKKLLKTLGAKDDLDIRISQGTEN